MAYSNLVLKLINNLNDIGNVDDDGNNICHHIASCGDSKIFEKLNKKNSVNWKNLLNQRNCDGDTPLHLAVKNNKQSLANKYIKLGANKNLPDLEGNIIDFENEQKGGNILPKIKGSRNL